MIEILFKAKRTENKEWVQGSLLFDPDLLTACIVGFNYDYSYEDGISRSEFSYDICLDTICRCTGLTDKNGRMIFEGDILKGNPDREFFREDFVMQIGFKENGWKVKEVGCDYWDDVSDRYISQYEVVGNIFDTPELLQNDEQEEQQ